MECRFRYQTIRRTTFLHLRGVWKLRRTPESILATRHPYEFNVVEDFVVHVEEFSTDPAIPLLFVM